MEKKEHRIARRGCRPDNPSETEAGVGSAVRITLNPGTGLAKWFAEHVEGTVPDCEGRRLVLETWRLAARRKPASP
jgi:hypothetical protein